jgi:hypothetical protein
MSNKAIDYNFINKKLEIDKSIPSKYGTFFILISTFSILLFSFYAKSISVFSCFIFFGCIGCLCSSLQKFIGIKIFILIYSIATIFSIILFFLFEFQYGTPYQGGGSDGIAYESFALEIKNALFYYDAKEIGFIINQPYHNSKGYIYILSIFMKISDLFGGFHTMIPRLFNANLLALCSVMIFNIAKKVSLSRQQAINCALVIGLFPIMLYTALQPYRDIIILFILLLSVLLALSFIESQSILKKFIIFASYCFLVIVILEIRQLNVINVVSMFVVALLIKYLHLKRVSNLHIFLTAISIALFSIIIYSSDLAIFLEFVNTLDSSQSQLAEGVDRAGEGGLSLILFNLPSPLKYLGTIFYSFITPLPIFYTNGFEWNLLSLGTIFQFLFIPFIILGVKDTFRSRGMLPLFVMFMVTYVGYVFGTFTFRHITYIVPFAAIYGTIGYENYKQHKRIIFSVAGGILFFLIFIYYVIKIIF